MKRTPSVEIKDLNDNSKLGLIKELIKREIPTHPKKIDLRIFDSSPSTTIGMTIKTNRNKIILTRIFFTAPPF